MTKSSRKALKKSLGSTQSAASSSIRSLEDALSNSVEHLPGQAPSFRAQELIYKAWDIPNPAKQIALAKQALGIDPDCVDAYALLAEEQAHSLEASMQLYGQGVAAGERTLGSQYFKENEGLFWVLLETRPYMRARLGLAQVLWQFGERRAAIDHTFALLRLNPNDNQGVRYLLLSWLLLAGRHDEAEQLWNQYKDDGSAQWTWSYALMAYLDKGGGPEAERLLAEAIRNNPHVAPFLLGRMPLPDNDPAYIRPGQPDEATVYVLQNLELWQQTEGALRWLSGMVPAR